MNNTKEKIFLVDGSGFIFRAFHSMPTTLTRPDGTPINAVLGFCNMLIKLIKDAKSSNIIVVFDAKRENFRNEIYPLYKKHRKETPPELIPQFPIIRQAVDAFNLPRIEMEGYEADDLIATYAKQGKEQGKEVVIISSDKDLMQLVKEDVYMFDAMKSKIIKEPEVFEKFGVKPNRVIDVQALAGDSSDNVPGVEGIGIKTAAALIQEYGDLETLLERAEEIKQNKRREKLIEHSDLARISKQLVTLKEDVPVELNLQDFQMNDVNVNDLVSFCEEQGFKTLTSRVKTIFSNGNDTTENSDNKDTTKPNIQKEIKSKYSLIQTDKQLNKLIEEIENAGIVAIDSETDSLVPATCNLIGLSFSTKLGIAYYLPLAHKSGDDQDKDQTDLFGESKPDTKKDDLIQLPLKETLKKLKPILEDEGILKIGHNLKYDYQVFMQYDIHLYPIDDTMVMSYLLDGSTHGHSLDELSLLYFDHTNIKFKDIVEKGQTFANVDLDKACDYASEDADMTFRLYQLLSPRMVKEDVKNIYERVERPLISAIAKTEFAGISIDKKSLLDFSLDLEKELEILTKEIHKLADCEFNIASPSQMSEVLFDKLKIPGGKKTKTGSYSTNISILEPLAKDYPIVEKILKYRKYAKLDSTYAKALPKQIQEKTGKVHTSFSLTGTNTGRLASSNPNLQNIPIRDELGLKIRKAFIPSDGNVFVSADYSQIELRLVADLSNCKKMQEAYLNNEDIHKKTASLVFKVPLDKVTKDLRYKAKAINFGIIYGISAHGLSVNLNCSRAEAKQYIDSYLNEYTEIKEYMNDQVEYAKVNGYVRTLMGRKIFLPTINSSNKTLQNFAIRQAMNAPLQGTGADIIKLAMVNVIEKLEKQNLKSKVVLTVHDELIIDAKIEEKEKIKKLLKETMENVVKMKIPLLAEPSEGKNWKEAK